MQRHTSLSLAIATVTLAIAPLALASCEGVPTSVLAIDAGPDAQQGDAAPFVCPFEPLPFTGNTAEPLTITNLRIECTNDILTPLLTATHPIPDQLVDVQQAVGVFLEPNCLSVPRMATTAIVSGEEASFGQLVARRLDPDLHASICAATEWPMSVFTGTKTTFPTTIGNVMVIVDSVETATTPLHSRHHQPQGEIELDLADGFNIPLPSRLIER